MTLTDQISFGAIHTVSDQRGGTPEDQANAAVGAYLQQRRKIALDTLSLILGLSAIGTGLDQIERGRSAEGARIARHGLDYLRQRISEEQQ